MSRLIVSILILSAASANACADGHVGRRKLADKHGPAGIMGDHMHRQGRWMVEYRYMNMYMEDNRIGRNEVSDADAIAATVDGISTNNGATPTDMTMEMHMTHLMYGATDDITLYTMLMLPSLTMDHRRANTTEFRTHNSGFGDTAFGALLRLYGNKCSDLILNLGGTVPTGDIFRTTSIPTGAPTPFPYPMRLGSGTFNARPGMTYKRFFDNWSTGLQFQTDLPIGRNYRGYDVGEEFRLNSWTSLLMTENWALSIRSEHVWRTGYDGEDPQTPDAIISTNVEAFRGGYWHNLGLGSQGSLGRNYFNLEIVPTIFQDLDGIQLETDFSVVASWSRNW